MTDSDYIHLAALRLEQFAQLLDAHVSPFDAKQARETAETLTRIYERMKSHE